MRTVGQPWALSQVAETELVEPCHRALAIRPSTKHETTRLRAVKAGREGTIRRAHNAESARLKGRFDLDADRAQMDQLFALAVPSPSA
jgi:hypothetical protein